MDEDNHMDAQDARSVNSEFFDVQKDAVDKLKTIFPEAVRDGEVDFEALKEALGVFDSEEQEHYGLNWTGKREAKRLAWTDVAGRTLRFIPEESKDADTTHNLYIEGDNLEVLKMLRRNYYGSIKMIYIDPPYNHDGDVLYPDDFKISQRESDEEEGDIVDGMRMIKSQKGNNRYHANWLNIMLPRLRVAKDLLSSDGVIFISIDDDEQANLKEICEEIFGLNNFIAQFAVASNSSKNNSQYVSISHEYILCYAKCKDSLTENWSVKKNNVDEYVKRAKQLLARNLSHDEIHEELLELVKYPRFYDFDHFTYVDERGVFQTNDPGGVENGNKITQIIHPVTGKPCAMPSGGWRYSEDEIKRKLENNEFDFGVDETIIPRPKRYLMDYLEQVPKSVPFFDSQGSTKWMNKNGICFKFPKSYAFQN